MSAAILVKLITTTTGVKLRNMTVKKFCGPFLCVVFAFQAAVGQKLAVARQTDSEPEQLSRMEAAYHEWLSTAEKRDLLVEFDRSPQSLEASDPRFSWITPLEGRGRSQTGYRIQVASKRELLESGKRDMWDSKLVGSTDSTNVYYRGRAFDSNHEYFWRVRVRDESGQLHPYSHVATFRTGLPRESDWIARWIGRGRPDEVIADVNKFLVKKVGLRVEAIEPDLRSPMFRKEFQVERRVSRATLFISGLGLYEARLNGQKVGNTHLSPAVTDYRKRVLYDAYDVTRDVRKGRNALGIILGNGWYNSPKKWWGWQMQWYGSPRAIAQLEIRYTDGTSSRVATDESWKAAWGPVSFNSIYDGEDYDARLEQKGWDLPGFDEGDWQSVNTVAPPGGKLVSSGVQPSLATQLVRPISIAEKAPGVFIYDLGQNFSGWVRLRVSGPGGTNVKLRYAEASKPDGSLDPRTMKPTRGEDNYTLRGGGGFETYETKFAYRAFQYVELTGYPGKPTSDTIEGVFVHTGVKPMGFFESANELINRIHLATVETQRMDIQMGVPIDSPQRAERLGWGADALISAEEAMFNLDMPRVYAKWMADFQDEQEASGLVPMIAPRAGLEEDIVWSSAYVAIPWMQYVHYGDRRVLEDHYASLVRYMYYLERQGRAEITPRQPGADPLSDAPETGTPVLGRLQRSQWGDHGSLDENFKGRSGLPFSISTAFYYHDAQVMEKIATALFKTEDATRFKKLAAEIKDAFNRKFFDEKTTIYDDGSQASQAFALSFELVPENLEEGVMNALLKDMFEKHQGHLTTGYPGTWCLIDALTRNGRADVVWHLATRTDFPSWGDMLKGRTSASENWKGGSLSHVALVGPIDAWFFNTIAGIRPDEEKPGFERVTIKPYIPKDLPWARGTLESVRGRIESSWRKESGSLRLDVGVPANTTALVFVPTLDPAAVREGRVRAVKAKGVKLLRQEGGAAVYQIGSGRYSFSAPLNR